MLTSTTSKSSLHSSITLRKAFSTFLVSSRVLSPFLPVFFLLLFPFSSSPLCLSPHSFLLLFFPLFSPLIFLHVLLHPLPSFHSRGGGVRGPVPKPISFAGSLSLRDSVRSIISEPFYVVSAVAMVMADSNESFCDLRWPRVTSTDDMTRPRR